MRGLKDRHGVAGATVYHPEEDRFTVATRQLYAGLVKECGFNQPELFRRLLVTRLSQKYVVNVTPMQYRLQRWPLRVWEKVDQALKDRADSLPLV